jgi:hypothetical protein
MSIWQKRPSPTPGYQIEEIDGELLLFHPATQIIMHTNQTGALVWNLCDGQRTVAEIIAVLCAAYTEAADNITADVPDILTQLAQQGAIMWA